MKIFFQSLFFFLMLSSCREALAVIDQCKVISVAGNAEISTEELSGWRPFTLPVFLNGGDRIRTSDKSSVEISTNSDHTGILRLGSRSQLEVIGDDLARFTLRSGSLMILREEDGDVPGKPLSERGILQVFTPDMKADLLLGGCSFSVSSKGTWIRIFSEHVNVMPFGRDGKSRSPKTIPEGFKYFLSSSIKKTGPLGPTRMYYSDYTDWQFWVRKCYERQDAVAENLLLKK